MHCETPQMGGNHSRPIVTCKKNHGPSAVAKVTDAFLRNAVLMVSVDATKGESLIGGRASLAKSGVGKHTIVAMIVMDPIYAESLGKDLKFCLGSH